MPQQMELAWNGSRYRLETNGDQLVISEVSGSYTQPAEERLPLTEIGGEARADVAAGNVDTPAVRVALGGVLSALATRGG